MNTNGNGDSGYSPKHDQPKPDEEYPIKSSEPTVDLTDEQSLTEAEYVYMKRLIEDIDIMLEYVRVTGIRTPDQLSDLIDDLLSRPGVILSGRAS